MTGVRVAAVVVTYNRFEKLQLSVSRLLAEPITDLVIIDNASTDETPAWLDSLHDSRIHLITSGENLGGAGGFAVGVEAAASLGADWILVLDDDAYPEPGAITEFLATELSDDIGGVAGAVFTPDGVIAEINRPGLDPFHRRRGKLGALFVGRKALHVPDEAFDAAATDVDCVSFVGYFVRGDLVRGELGVPDASLFIYSDDQMYTFRVWQLGYRNVLIPRIRFVHDTLTYMVPGVVTPVWRIYYLYRNNLEFYRRMAGRWFPVVVPVKLLTWTWRGRRHPTKRLYFRMMRHGVCDGLRCRMQRNHDEVLGWAGEQPASNG